MNSIKDLSPTFTPLNSQSAEGPKRADGRDAKMMEAAKQFETQFIRQMISEMRKTVPKDEILDQGMADDIYQDQLDDQYADQWADQGGIGLSDLIYQQLQERYGKHTEALAKPGTVFKLPAHSVQANRVGTSPSSQVHDLLSRADGNLFLAKKVPGGFSLKSREPLPESVGLRSPLSGVVLQTATLPNGQQMIVIKHDQGLVTQIVHSGTNRVKTNTRVTAGEIVAELPPSRQGEDAHVFFGLREAAKTE